MGIPGDGTVWSVNSSQFIREKMTGSDAFYDISIGFDEDARLYSLVVSISLVSKIRPNNFVSCADRASRTKS